MRKALAMKLAKRIERIPLAWPMALLMAAAIAFLMFAMPARIMAQLLEVAGLSGLVPAVPAGVGAVTRTIVAAGFAGLGGGAVWLLFHMLDDPRAPRTQGADSQDGDVAIDLFASRASLQPVQEAPLLRRKDVHPDAPARRPLFAASDLGAPMDEQPAPPRRAPIFTETPEVEPAGEPAGTEDSSDALMLGLDDIVETPAEEKVEAEWSLTGASPDRDRHSQDEIHSKVATTEAAAASQPERPAARIAPAQTETARPTVQPAPVSGTDAAERAHADLADESLAGLMARLERALAARGGMPAALPAEVADAAGTLRQALNELRTMATRR